MPKKRHSPEQIISKLRDADALPWSRDTHRAQQAEDRQEKENVGVSGRR